MHSLGLLANVAGVAKSKTDVTHELKANWSDPVQK